MRFRDDRAWRRGPKGPRQTAGRSVKINGASTLCFKAEQSVAVSPKGGELACGPQAADLSTSGHLLDNDLGLLPGVAQSLCRCLVVAVSNFSAV